MKNIKIKWLQKHWFNYTDKKNIKQKQNCSRKVNWFNLPFYLNILTA